MDGTWLGGIDGCAGGWAVAFVRPAGDEVRLRVLPTFAAVIAAPEAPALIAVDMPIGLPARAGPGGRAAETAVRPLLGARQSSVFSVPSRAAIEAADYGEACRVALATSDPPRKVSRQLFMLAPKIREIDALLRTTPGMPARVHETHPELVFWRLNGRQPLSEPKKVKSRPFGPGLDLRRALLRSAGLSPSVLEAAPPRGSGPDDVLDALACALTARRIYTGDAKAFPNPPPRDESGLAMAIWV